MCFELTSLFILVIVYLGYSILCFRGLFMHALIINIISKGLIPVCLHNLYAGPSFLPSGYRFKSVRSTFIAHAVKIWLHAY